MRAINDVNVCVVGGAGFLGSHLVQHLLDDRACRVLVVDNLVVGRREFVDHRATFVHHDICTSEEYLCKLFKACNIDYVFNYAAYPYIPDSFARPLRVFDVNAFGAMKVINAAQEAGVKAILQVSSAEIYGESTGLMDENSKVVPHSSYGASKAAIDSWIQARWREAKTPCIALRQFNCVGERETHPYVVPEIMKQLAGSTSSIRGLVRLGNNSVRDFMYAKDAVRIAVQLLERGVYGDVYNLGSENAIHIYDLAKLIGEVMGFDSVDVVHDDTRVRPWEIWHLRSNNAKVYGLLGPLDLMPLRKAIERTAEYFVRHDHKWCWEK